MPTGWSTSAGLDLHLPPARTVPGASRRLEVEAALRDAIIDGRLAAGARIPSSRSLAEDLGVARGTVTAAYEQLIAEGWLQARHGSGTRVADRAAPEVVAPAVPSVVPPGDPPSLPATPRHDFRPGRPDVSSFPRAAWVAALRRALETTPDASFGYGDPQGHAVLRTALSAYITRTRGVRTDPSLIVVTNGWGHGLPLLAGALAAGGTTSAFVENPCIPTYRAAFGHAGVPTYDLAVDGQGADPASLRPATRGVVLLTPAHQYPTGTTLSPARRQAFVTWARQHDALIVEDDYDGEFRFDRQPVGALQGLDPERVVYAGTASKSLAPGVRLGWLAVPGALVEPLTAARDAGDRHTGVLEQLAFADLLESGGFDRHVRRQRARYRRRRDAVVAAVGRRTPALEVRGIAAGLHLVVTLPRHGPRERDVVAHLAAAGVAVHALGSYRRGAGRFRGGIVVGYGSPAEHTFTSSLRALTAGLAALYPGA